MVSIVFGLIKLPKPAKPILDSRHLPYIEAMRARRWTFFIGIVTFILTIGMLWAHSRIPSDTGKLSALPQDWNDLRIQLKTFFAAFAPIPLLQLLFWLRVTKASHTS